MSSTALDEWNEQFGGDEDFTKDTRRRGFPFQYDMSYKVKVVKAKVGESSRGDVQIEMDLQVLDGSDEPQGSHKEWLTLPKQKTDSNLDRETVFKLTLRRRDDLQRIMSRVDPQTYALYDHAEEGRNGKTAYIGFDGQEMTGDEMDARTIEINRAVMALADELHDAINEELDGWPETTFYIVKAPNPKSDKYPYTNFYARPNPKLPVWHGNDAVPF